MFEKILIANRGDQPGAAGRSCEAQLRGAAQAAWAMSREAVHV
jgi:hypothetical protein